MTDLTQQNSSEKQIAASIHGSMKPGPSEDYKALLRGEITSEEYVRRIKTDVHRTCLVIDPPRFPRLHVLWLRYIGWRYARAACAVRPTRRIHCQRRQRRRENRCICPTCFAAHVRDESERPGEKAGTEASPVGLHQPHPVREKPGTGSPLRADAGSIPAPSVDPEDAEMWCEVCERRHGVVWFAPSDLWNAVMREGERGKPDEFAFCCPMCFILLAEKRGFPCEVCGAWLAFNGDKHDRELHQIAALERIAAALEADGGT